MKLLLKNRSKSERTRKGNAANPAGIFSCGIFSWDSVFDRVNDLCAVAMRSPPCLRTLSRLDLPPYWLGAMVVALRVSVSFIWYLPCFAVTLLLGVGLYGVNAFLFTRANTIGDGLFFVAAWACILPAVLAAMASLGWDFVYRPFVGGVSLQRLSDAVFTYSGMAWGVTPFEYFICADAIDYETCVRACVASVLAVSEAVAAYVLLFVRADRDQAEDAEQISSSWWGYRILIPVYVVCLMCFIPPDFRWDNIFLMAIVLVGAFIGFFAYRRSFRLQRSDFISIGVTYAVGILLMLIGG